MLKLLLDEHVSPDVASGLRRRDRQIIVHSMARWEDGSFLGQADADCLAEAAARGLTLVTYDRRTIPPLLRIWTEEGRSHGGVIFVDEKTISPANIGALIRALGALVKEARNRNWIDRVCFLRR